MRRRCGSTRAGGPAAKIQPRGGTGACCLFSIPVGLLVPDEIDSGVPLALFFPCHVRPGAKVFVGALTFSLFPNKGEAESTAKAGLASIKAAVSRARFLNIVHNSGRFNFCTPVSASSR